MMASGSHDISIRLWWMLRQDQQKAKLEGHSDRVYSICYSPNGNTLSSGSHDKSICLWNLKTGKLKANKDGHKNAVNSICYSPNGNTLVSGSHKSVYPFMRKTGKLKAKLDGHSDMVQFNLLLSQWKYISILQDYEKPNQMVIQIKQIQFVTLLMEIHQNLAVMIKSIRYGMLISIYGMLRQDNQKPNQIVIQMQLIQFVTLLMEIHQHLVIMISLSFYLLWDVKIGK
ncbi:unnamed protein product [Paramecium octaurelia]|uniref:Uncharacterized protein n=1 Tax=Paramecium octaurelia TaxID=43137 RepID=A0A8S1WRT6_PAROT|nr:unnamed protein product [Paramecium octaurelia]